ncbi:flagellar motor protein MotB [Alkalilimnicola ehrlichii]|uniref:Flagellar motor protein MotB n=1 Tax=Alkalilimnicola ehrlichii TaxID=351052 RepID=A0A3E0X318_9GAMM|nr:flagellar motor protein MotB [Alkalilimnicola ehrlichii]RFA31040.1 flagellar motor protein MotB [Alkalilimnicola ehrlichii]RFA38993.1 flagellar motor protein MotB [Alkalilimnicola ehrlichii]
MDEKSQPIVIKRVKKSIHGGHGGSWKVAFADFMTAMFAMFLVLWLVAVMEAPQREGIAEYFRNPNPPGGQSGVSRSIIDLQGGSDTVIDLGPIPNEPMSGDELEEYLLELEQERLEALQEALEEAIDRSQALEPFKDQLLLDITPEGLRIQLVDRENRPMFPLGSSEPYDYARRILEELALVLNEVPNKISIAGHTDKTPFARPREDYGNWELSSDRAHAARRAMLAGGMKEERVAQVTGLASTVLFDKENPFNPINRRISIIVLNPRAEEAITTRESRTVEGF